MDNCSVHHVPEVKGMFMNVGIPVFFLPPYSPDYNPIEEMFSYVKTYLRRHDTQSVIPALLLRLLLRVLQLNYVTNG